MNDNMMLTWMRDQRDGLANLLARRSDPGLLAQLHLVEDFLKEFDPEYRESRPGSGDGKMLRSLIAEREANRKEKSDAD